MQTFANEDYIGDLHVAHICFGGDVFLQPGTKRFAEPVSERGKDNCKRNEQESPTGGTGSLQRCPGKSPGKQRGGRHVRPATLVDGESAFTGAESRQGFCGSMRYLFKLKITEQKKASRVGMSRHRNFMRACQHMQRGMFKRVITPGLKDEWKIE